MFQHHFRSIACVGLTLAVGVGVTAPPGSDESQVMHAAQPGAISLPDQQVRITELTRGEQEVINVSGLSSNGIVSGSAPPAGNALLWLPGGQGPHDIGGGPSFLLTNRIPLISADGRFVAANRQQQSAPDEPTLSVPSLWSRGRGWTPLPSTTLASSVLLGMSDNASLVVGYGWADPQTTGHPQPWAWREDTGQQVLPVDSNMHGGEAWAVSADGRAIAGQQFIVANPPDPRREVYATRWIEGVPDVLVDGLGVPLGQAFTCNADCSVVVGGGQGGTFEPDHPNRGEAWMWSEWVGATYLGTHPAAAPETASYATDVNADGSMIVGTYYEASPEGALRYRGFLWTPDTGLVSITDMLAEHGIDHGSDWVSIVPTAVTAAGDMILVAGQDAEGRPSGFIVHLPVS